MPQDRKPPAMAPVSLLTDTYEQGINLGNEFKIGETYTVAVNDRSLSFKGQ